MEKKKSSGKKGKLLIAVIVVIAAIAVYTYYWHNWRFSGTALDAETGKPIEGAVVVASWRGGSQTIAGESTWVKDVKETLTGEEGEWMLRGPKGDNPITVLLSNIPFMSYTKRPEFIIYKPGYCPWPKGYQIEACGEMYVGDKKYGNIAQGNTLGLPKLTKRDDRSRALPGPVRTIIDRKKVEILKKQKEFIKLIDSERIYLGFEPYDFEFMREDKDEGQ